MAINNNIQDFLVDIADAIREAEGSSEAIAAQDFSTRIRALTGLPSDIGTRLDIDGFTLDSGDSSPQPPFDSQGYAPSANAPEKSRSVQKVVGDLTDYDQFSVVWDNKGSYNFYGDIYVKVIIDGTETTIFSGSSYVSGNTVTKIDVSGVTGNQTITFAAYAHSRSSYKNGSSRAIINVKGLYVATESNATVEV